MTIFPEGVSRAFEQRNELRRPSVSARRAAPTTWGQIEAAFSNPGHYSGLMSKEMAYRDSPWIQPTVHAFASALAARSFRMFHEAEGEKDRVLGHWLIDLMARPNTFSKTSDYVFKYQTFALYDFDGEVFWHLGRAGQGEPGKSRPGKKRGAPEFLTIFRKRDTRPILDTRRGEFIGWEFTIDGVPYFADRDDVVHFPHFDPLTHRADFNPFTMKLLEPSRGRSTLDSKRLAISADIAAARYNYDFFSRGIAPNVAFISKEDLAVNEDEFREKLRARLAGKNGEPVILSGDWTIQNISAAQKDAEFSKGRQIAREEQLAGRVPPIVMGKDDATYANAQAQLMTWWEVVLNPALMHFCATLDVNLLADEPDLWTDLSTDDVDALQEAKGARIDRAIALAGKRMPWDVAARTVGIELEQFEGSDVAFGSYTDVPIGDVIAVADAPAAETPANQPAQTTPAPAPDAAPVAAIVGLNGAQVTAATAIVVAVAAGEIPRDSGIGQLQVLFSLTVQQAEMIMGSAGKSDVPTTPNPNPAAVVDVAPAAQAPAVDAVPRLFRVMTDEPPAALFFRMAGPFDFSSTQVNLTGDAAKAVLDLAATIPDDALAEKGRETDAHITVKFGLDPEVTVRDVTEALANSDSVLEMMERGGGVLTFGDTAIFEAEEYDVVFVAVDSPDLVTLNDVIRNSGLKVTDTQPEYLPHATLAYVKPGRGAEFAGNAVLTGTVVTFDAIVFSDTGGEETQVPLAEAVASRARFIRVVTHPDADALTDPRGGQVFGLTRAASDLSWIAQIIRGDDADLQKLARKFHIRTLNDGAKQIGDLLKLDTLITIDNPAVVEFLKTRANLITSVNKTTADQVLTAVKAGINAGETPEDIADGLRDIYNLRKKQSDLIARNENGAALNGGRFMQMEEEGAEGLEWISSRDSVVRESHAQGTGVDGEIIALGETFSNGLRYPQDPDGAPEDVIGCRCIGMVAKLDGSRILRTEQQRAAYWRATMVHGLKQSDRQFASALGRYFTDQRAKVLAELAKKLT